MKSKIYLVLLVLLASCKPKPEFFIDGKPYYTRTKCVKWEEEYQYNYHLGFNYFTGKYEYHLGPHFESVCKENRTDTIEIKTNK